MLASRCAAGCSPYRGVSRGDYRVSGNEIAAELTFARPELESAVPGLDENGDGVLTAAEVLAGQPRLAGLLARGLEVRSGSRSCEGGFEGADLTEQDGLAVRAAYRCATGGALSVRLAMLESLSLGHRHIATATTKGGATVRAVLYETNPELHVDAGGNGNGNVAFQLFRMGIQHILTGYDHLLFLLGLILVGGRLRPLLVVVTAFTVAHSPHLAWRALGFCTESRLVEPAIASPTRASELVRARCPAAQSRSLRPVHGPLRAPSSRLPSSQVPLASPRSTWERDSRGPGARATRHPWLGRRPGSPTGA